MCYILSSRLGEEILLFYRKFLGGKSGFVPSKKGKQFIAVISGINSLKAELLRKGLGGKIFSS